MSNNAASAVPNNLVPFPNAIDLAAVRADDELIKQLAARLAVNPAASGDPADHRLVSLLQAWTAEVDARPLPAIRPYGTADANPTVSAPARLATVTPIRSKQKQSKRLAAWLHRTADRLFEWYPRRIN